MSEHNGGEEEGEAKPHRKNIGAAPQPHQLWETRDGKIVNTSDEVERRPAWTDLLFDLIIVGSFHQLGEHLHDDISERPWLGVLKYLIMFQPLNSLWQTATEYNNRFGTESWADALLAYTMLVALSGVNLSISVIDTPLGIKCYSGCIAAAYLALVLSFWRTGWLAPCVRSFSYGMAINHACTGAWWLVPFLLPNANEAVLAVCSIGSSITLVAMLRHLMRICIFPLFGWGTLRYVPLDVELHVERFGLLVMVAIGEMVIASASNAAMGSAGFDTWKSVGIMILVSSFAYLTKVLYFDLFDSLGEEVQKHALRISPDLGLTFMYLHTPLCMGITLSAGVLESITESESEAEYSLHRRVLTAAGMALVLNVSCLLHHTHYCWPIFSETELVPAWVRTTVNLAVGALGLVLSVFSCDEYSNSFVYLTELQLFTVLLFLMAFAALFEFLCQFVFVVPTQTTTVLDEELVEETVNALLDAQGETLDALERGDGDGHGDADVVSVNRGGAHGDPSESNTLLTASPTSDAAADGDGDGVGRPRVASRAIRAYLVHETGSRHTHASRVVAPAILEALQASDGQTRTRRHTVTAHPQYGTTSS